MESQGGVEDCKAYAITLEFRIWPATLPDEIRAADFAPHKVVRVIHHAHLVGLRIARAQSRKRFLCHACRSYTPVRPFVSVGGGR